MRGERAGIGADRRRLLRTPLAQRIAEAFVRDPVPAAHERRQEAARELVFALRAGLETGQAFAQAVLDALVVAGFEVQSRHGFGRAPVAAVERVAAAQAERA